MFIIDNTPSSSIKPFKSTQGHLRLDAAVTRSGIFKYIVDGEEQLHLRHPDLVFSQYSINGLAGLPIVLEHPIVDGVPIKVTPENFNKYGHGVLGDTIDIQNPYLIVKGCNLQTDTAIKAVTQAGINQTSLGYNTDVVADSGVYEGCRYTHRQVGVYKIDEIEFNEPLYDFNHLAITIMARAGKESKFLNVDSKIPLCYHIGYGDSRKIFTFNNYRQKPMTTRSIMYGDSSFTVDEAGNITIPASEFQSLIGELKEVKDKIDGAVYYVAADLDMLASVGAKNVQEILEKMTSLQSDKESAEKKATEAEQKATEAEQKVNEITQDSVQLKGELEKLKLDALIEKCPIKIDSVTSTTEYMKEVIKKVFPKIVIDSNIPEETLSSLYDTALSDFISAENAKGKTEKTELKTDSGKEKPAMRNYAKVS